MGHRLEKNMKIMEELVSFCTKRGSRDIDLNLNFEKTFSTITVSAKNTKASDEDLRMLKEALFSDRQHEVEECFWNITGEDYFGHELTITGVMIDDATVTYENNVLEIVAKRIED